jgi:hypothetical protein
MNIQEQLQQDLKSAMRNGEKLRVEVIRMTLAALKNAQIAQVKEAYDAAPDDGSTTIDRETPLSEMAMQQTVAREVKRRRDAAEVYRNAKREDLAQIEDAEAAILETYLPRQLTIDELRPLVAAAIADLGATNIAAMGKIMPALIQQFKGRADGRLINQVAREVLSGQH